MPFRLPVVSLIVAAGIFTLAITADAQGPPLWIQSVTVDAAAGTATITGTGFSETCAVTLDGHALTVLPGGTAARLVVVVPALLVATPGTYRLTVTDAGRQAGDAFEVTLPSTVPLVPASMTASSGAESGTAGLATAQIFGRSIASFASRAGSGDGLGLLEDSALPWTTAIGFQALANNDNVGSSCGSDFGCANTASGFRALYANTTGYWNTAVGYQVLQANTDGGANTAVGFNALLANTSGRRNSAVGVQAMQNSRGDDNTAVGVAALAVLSLGNSNVALGYRAGTATNGNSNIYLGADVVGVGSDSNTIRLGLPYVPAASPPAGINRTFIAGIRGTTVTGATPVGVNANGQLGMADKLGSGAGYGCATCYQAGTLELYNPGTGDLNIQSGPSYRTMLNPNGGNVGVGVTALFGAGAGFGCASCYQAGYVQFYNPATGQLTLQSGSAFDTLLNPYGGNVGVGVTDAVYPLQMASGAHVTAGGVWTNASSRALKEHITPLTLERAQEALLALAPVEYTYKADPTQHQVGFIAEDVPALVAQNDRASLSPMDLVAVLTKIVQAQQAQVTAQQAQLAALQAQVAQLIAAQGVEASASGHR